MRRAITALGLLALVFVGVPGLLIALETSDGQRVPGIGILDAPDRADAIVVLGSAVYYEGKLGPVLQERFDSALALYAQGLAPTLVFSGGDGWGPPNEADEMRRQAIERGVPESAIVADREGHNTRASARNVARVAAARGWSHVIVVTHYYHLPRTKMAFAQEGIARVSGAEATGRRVDGNERTLAREIVAFWAYAVRAR